MGTVDEGSNGMSYDFGVMIARGTVAGLAATVAGVVALTGAIVSLVSGSEAMDNRLNKNQIALGGYANTMKAIQFAQGKVLDGAGFTTDDMIAGFKELGRAGLDAKQNFDLVAAAASGSGKDFADISSIVRNGDYSALAEMGVITDRMATRMEGAGYSQKRNTQEVVKLLKQADEKGMFKGAVQTLEAIKMRLVGMKDLFVQSIIGDPKDPEGLAVTVKKHLNAVADFFVKHKNTIIYYGKMVGLVLRTTFRVVGDFVKMIAKNVLHLDRYKEKSTKTMQDQLMSFGLWLEIQRARIRVFFEDYGKYIGWIVKALLIYKALKFGTNLWSSAISGATRYFRIIRIGLWKKKKDFIALGSALKNMWTYLGQQGSSAISAISKGIPSILRGFSAMRNSMMAFNVVAMLNPVGLIVIAVLAVIAAVVLLIAYWDDLWYKFQDMSDAWGLLLGPLFLIIKYWEEIKATVGNFWNYLKSKALEVYLQMLMAWDDFKSFFTDMWNGLAEFVTGIWQGITNTFHEWFDPILNYLGEFFSPLIEAATKAWNWLNDNFFTPIKDFFTGIGKWIMSNIIDPVKSFIGGIGDFFGNLFGKGVDKSNELLQSQANSTDSTIDQALKKGVITQEQANNAKIMNNSYRSEGMTNQQVQEKKTEKKASMKAEYAKKDAEKNGGIGSELSKGGSKIDFIGKNPDFENLGSSSSNTTNVQKGAVVINVGAGSGLDENKLASLVEKKLKELGYKNKMREGL